MPTYSLTLRSEKGSKLTTQELDNNFLYVLENATGGGSQGPQGPQGYQGPSGGGGGGGLEIVSMTISVDQLTTSFLEGIEVIPAPGAGKMTVPIWGRYRMINGGSKWPDKSFKVYPDGPQGPQGAQGSYLIGYLVSDKYYALGPQSFGTQGIEYFENTSFLLSTTDDYYNTTLYLSYVTTAFSVGDVISGVQGGSNPSATASVVLAGEYDSKNGYQTIIVNDVVPISPFSGFNNGDAVTGVPSGGSAIISSIELPITPGDYDMELYLGYQTFDLL